MFLPRALSAIPDAKNALARLSEVFHAEVMTGPAFKTDTEQKSALEVKEAVFQWESLPSAEDGDKADEDRGADSAPIPFQVRVTNMTVPRGSLIAIVGPVGSGKVHSEFILSASPLTQASVQPSTGPDRRNATYHWTCIIWRSRQLLSSDRMDPECNPCTFNGHQNYGPTHNRSRGTTSYLVSPLTKINIGKPSKMPPFFPI
jgi:hypothetical protein